MKLSALIYRLKRQARILSRQEAIPYHQALDRVARDEGFGSWGLLAAHESADRPSKRLKEKLQPGDLVTALGEDPLRYSDRFEFDDSDEICAAHITSRLQSASPGTVVIIDYLQLLDQRRESPDLFGGRLKVM